MSMVCVVARGPGAMFGNMVCVANSSLVDISVVHAATKSHVGVRGPTEAGWGGMVWGV